MGLPLMPCSTHELRRVPLTQPLQTSSSVVTATPTIAAGGPPLPHGRPRTVIVTGPARGGTSFAASICHHLGVPMGRQGPKYENPYLQRALTLGAWDVIEMLVAEISADLPIWGWKMPAIIQHLGRVEDLVRAPHFILVFKNPLSLTAHGKVLSKALKSYKVMAQFVESTSSPILLVSYESAVSDMPTTIRAFADFCGTTVTDVDQIISQVAQDKRDYYSRSRAHREPTSLDARLMKIANSHGVTLARARSV
jgi:hypothetical protein